MTRRLWDPSYAASQARSRARWLVKASETGRDVSGSALAYARRVLAGEVDPQATRRLVPGSQAEASIRRAAARGYEPALLILPPWAVRQAVRGGLAEGA